MKKLITAIAATAALFAISPGAQAASEESWEEFRETVASACTVIANDVMDVETIRVDPFGSKSYGIAIVSGGGEERVCVYHKAADVAEIGEPIPAEGTAMVEPDESEPASDLATQVAATLADLAAKGLETGERAVRVAALIAEEKPGDVASFPPGSYDCTVYWYGFLGEGTREVGTHQCKVVSTSDGGRRVEKTTGERLNAVFLPTDSGNVDYVGRTFLPGHEITEFDPDRPANPENDNFGNKTGVVLRDGMTLYLVSIDERGFTEPDPTFFEVLEISETK